MQIWKEETDHLLDGSNRAHHLEDARQVARQLDIPFRVLEMGEVFEEEVTRYFCEEYGAGRTPNPCVLCNERVKFGIFLQKAKEMGGDYVATGHYARVEYDPGRERYLLKKGVDSKKDQSYFLFTLRQDQLRYVLLPLGEYRKDEMRRKALHSGLRVHDKQQSQEVCFISQDSYRPFLTERLKGSYAPGPIVDRAGNLLGTHRGIPFYTIGQRRGLRLAKGIPLYVVEIDRQRNTVVVGGEGDILGEDCIVDSVKWIIPPADRWPLAATVKIRYNHPGSRAILTLIDGERVRVKFDLPQKAITPGQAAVFYDGDTVLGGGWIDRMARSSEE
jgi:tRNA-specific 2-thiouridylase